MASTRLDIRDVWAAAHDGRIAGQFVAVEGVAAARFVFEPVVRRSRRGGTQTWTQRVTLYAADGTPLAFTPAIIGAPPHPVLPDGTYAEIDVDYRTVGVGADGAEIAGDVRKRPPKRIDEGKRAGTVRATNAASQALLDAASEHRKKLRAARADDGAHAPGTNAPAADAAAAPVADAAGAPAARTPVDTAAASSALFYPMLVQPFGKTKAATLTDDEFAVAAGGVYVQPKLDGLRAVARDSAAAAATPYPVADGDVLLTSRTAQVFPGFAHLREALGPMFAAWRACEEDAGRPGALYLDGEIFTPGKPLNYISGKARKNDADDSDLEYHVFDAYDPARPAAPYAARRAWVAAFFAAAPADSPVKQVETLRVETHQELDDQYRRFIARGDEGAIVRRGARAYESGARNYHSSALLKLKPRPDSEFRVVGFGKGTGSHAGAVLWVCEVPAADAVPDAKTGEKRSRTFKVGSMRGWSLGERRRVYDLLSEKDAAGRTRFERDFRSLCLTVEYAGLSAKTGVPLQPRGVAFKRTCADAEGQADDLLVDPIRQLLAEHPKA